MQPQLTHPVVNAYRGTTGSAGTLAALVDAHQSERRLLDELIGTMRRQRSAVATDDLQGVDDSVFATHRILVTLGEARRRRRSLNTILGGSDELDTHALIDACGGSIPKPLEEARDALRAAAATLAGEVDVNRRVLREALASGDEYMRRLVGAPDATRSDYSPSATPQHESRGGGLLLDRRV
jgi:hypothetical protein